MQRKKEPVQQPLRSNLKLPVQQERLDTLMSHFADILPRMIDEHPDMYIYPKTDVPKVVARIKTALERTGGVNGVIIDSPTWRAVCKALGIKHTKKALNAYLAGA